MQWDRWLDRAQKHDVAWDRWLGRSPRKETMFPQRGAVNKVLVACGTHTDYEPIGRSPSDKYVASPQRC
eukprot:12162574-Prorocentrum_lima.AAC.1